MWSIFWIRLGVIIKAFKAVLRGCLFFLGFIWFKADGQIWLAGFIHNQNFYICGIVLFVNLFLIR